MKLVSQASRCDDQFWILGVELELQTQPSDVGIDHASVAMTLWGGPLDLLHDHPSGHRLPFFAHQKFEQPELHRRQLDLGQTSKHLPNAVVNRETTDHGLLWRTT